MRRALPLLLVLLLAGCSTPVDDNLGDVTALRTGDCFAAFDGPEVSSVPPVDCAGPHDFEVYAVLAAAGDTYPGENAVVAEAGDGCSDGFAGFLGVDYPTAFARGYDFTTLYPTDRSWALGDRDLVCAIARVEDGAVVPVRGTLKGAEG